jgi:hypothetical protein
VRPINQSILYETLPDGKRRALIKYESPFYTVAYHSGAKHVRQKFSGLAKARREADIVAIKLANLSSPFDFPPGPVIHGLKLRSTTATAANPSSHLSSIGSLPIISAPTPAPCYSVGVVIMMSRVHRHGRTLARVFQDFFARQIHMRTGAQQQTSIAHTNANFQAKNN